MRRVFIRADGNSKMGLGHIFRAMAVAEMLQSDFACTIWMNNPPVAVAQEVGARFENKNSAFTSAQEEISAITQTLKPDDILILDGYHFNDQYQQAIKPHVQCMISIDDIAATPFYSDIVINHGSENMQARYQVNTTTKLLLGPRYAMLRQPFLAAAEAEVRTIDAIGGVFICMGGADPFNVTTRLVRVAGQIDTIKQLTVVIGGAYNFQAELNTVISQLPAHIKCTTYISINAEKIIELLRDTQIAICPASTVALEAASVRTGLLTGMVADNQEAIHNMILQAGAAMSVGDFNMATDEELVGALEQMDDPVLLNNIIKNQQKFIDGLSSQRIKQAINEICKC